MKDGYKVLFFASDVRLQSGASYALCETVKRVSALGVKPIVVIPDTEDSYKLFPEKHFDVVYLKMRRVRRTLNPKVQLDFMLSIIPMLTALYRIIKQNNVKILHFNEITDFFAGFVARLCGIPVVCHVRADGIPNPFRKILLILLNIFSDAVIVPSKSNVHWITEDYQKLSRKVSLIYDYAFDRSKYDHTISGSAFRAELGLSEDDKLVVLVSKLQIPKGHICFINAVAEVLKTTQKVTFVIVGGGVDGHDEDLNKIMSLADDLVNPESLRFVGQRTDLPMIYAACDIAVHCPIYPDPYPTVVLLAMLMGKPVIGSDIGGIPEQIEHDVTGILVPPDDPIALANAICLLVRDEIKAKSLGSMAMERVRTDFSPDKQADLIISVYDSLLSSTQRNKRAQ